MRIAVLSHSLVHPRQQIFFDYFGKTKDVVLLQVKPSSWGPLKAENGFSVKYEGNLTLYEFGEDAEKAIIDFSPDVIYCQAEWWSKQANKSAKLAQRIGCKYVLFAWENMKELREAAFKETIKLSDLVVCGNNRAREIVAAVGCNTVKMPQVGIDTELFKPLTMKKESNLVFIGRTVPEKGVEIITKIAKKLDISLKFISGVPYEKLPKFYNRGQVFISFPYSVPWWTEQFAPYAALEALSCGLPVITSNSGSIPEWLCGCPGVVILQEKDELALEHTLKAINWVDRMPLLSAREGFIIPRFSKEAVSSFLKEILGYVAEGKIGRSV